ncbi:MAG: carboxypeptidase-like regulatory domain-containing protein, partial [Candidatus Poribacteria bacterium]|nr:carboxypeptidase-like regulatory domain-containing protein [Candidatus Poribacteria bacterium]
MHQFFSIISRSPKTDIRIVAIVITLAILLSIPHFCQGSTEISGKVIDKETGEPILGAVVQVESDGQTLAETTTGGDGNFQITQDTQGKKVIQVSSTGYHNYTETLTLTHQTTRPLEISLSSQTFQLAPIEIIGESARQHRKITGTMSMLEPEIVDLIKPVGTQELLELIPGINGYADDGHGHSHSHGLLQRIGYV